MRAQLVQASDCLLLGSGIRRLYLRVRRAEDDQNCERKRDQTLPNSCAKPYTYRGMGTDSRD